MSVTFVCSSQHDGALALFGASKHCNIARDKECQQPVCIPSQVSVPGHHRTASSGSNQDSPFAGCYNIIPALLVQKEEKVSVFCAANMREKDL